MPGVIQCSSSSDPREAGRGPWGEGQSALEWVHAEREAHTLESITILAASGKLLVALGPIYLGDKESSWACLRK